MVGNKKTVFPEKKTFTNDLGLEVEYWVMKPTNYKQGEKYPLLLKFTEAMWDQAKKACGMSTQYFVVKAMYSV
jgi:enterochelin esterase-like enzyme